MRLDNYLVKLGLFSSRTKARQAIDRGEITVNDNVVNKASFEIDENSNAKINRFFIEEFVSLGGFKLSKALKDFKINPTNLICADIGASTGGFTDCLLKNGAKKVYAVDLNDQLLCDKLKNDKRVVPLVKNAKNLVKNDFNDELDLIVVDLSFIPVELVLPVLKNLLKTNGLAIILIKPQFENDKKISFKNGIIKDKDIRYNACQKVVSYAENIDFSVVEFTNAPKNDKKNYEYLILLKNIKSDCNFNLKKYENII